MKYRYIANGMFFSENGEEYYIDIPSPYIRYTVQLARIDEKLGYQFVATGNNVPVIHVYPKESLDYNDNDTSGNRRLVHYIKGKPVYSYFWDDFINNGGKIKKLKTESFNKVHIDRLFDLEDTDKTFSDLFPNLRYGDLPVHIDYDSYDIEEVTG